MREIKFRAWNNLAHKMACITAIDFMLDSYRAIAGKSSGSGHLADIELMQFTGLKDSKGNEIYEGDIVIYEHNNSTGWHEQKRVVTWNEKAAAFEVPTHGIFTQKIEVIGNIYENPELLLAKE